VIFTNVIVCKRVSECTGEVEQSGLVSDFVYDDCWRKEKVKEETNRDFIRKRRIWKKDRNYGVLGHDNMP